MTPEEKEILLRLSSKAQRYQTSGKKESKNPQQLALDKSVEQSPDDVPHTDIYAANLSLLQNKVYLI